MEWEGEWEGREDEEENFNDILEMGLICKVLAIPILEYGEYCEGMKRHGVRFVVVAVGESN